MGVTFAKPDQGDHIILVTTSAESEEDVENAEGPDGAEGIAGAEAPAGAESSEGARSAVETDPVESAETAESDDFVDSAAPDRSEERRVGKERGAQRGGRDRNRVVGEG